MTTIAEMVDMEEIAMIIDQRETMMSEQETLWRYEQEERYAQEESMYW